MIGKIKHLFALSDKGARGLVKAVIWTVICDLSLMLPIGVIMASIMYLLEAVPGGQDPLGKVLIYTGAAIAVLLLIVVLHYFQYGALYLSTYEESASRRISLAETLRKLPLSFFGNRNLSDLTATMISDCSSLDQMFSHFIPQLIASSISTALVGIILFITNWRLALAVLWVVPVALLLTVGSKKLQDKYGQKSINAKLAVTDGVQECLDTMKEIKSSDLQDDYLTRMNGRIKAAETATIHAELVTGVFISSAQAFLKLGLATTILTGVSLLISGQAEYLIVLGFLFAAARLYDPLGLILQNIAATFNAKLKIKRMRSVMEAPVQTGAEEFSPHGFDISFDQVSFAYQEGSGVLDNVSFTAKQGQVTALVGPSGGGKSTATKLAARFWDVNKGKITLGGVDISTVDPEALLKHYAIVFQDVVLFRDTIMENIRLGRRDASDQEVLSAARLARCDEFISQLPEGYQTIIGENGSTLSGGERQRISIARALLKDAQVILLDEATASLDVENESAVQAALSQLIRNKTVLIIAHRMRTVAGADKILVLKEGRIVESGAPKELLESGKYYPQMVKLQEKSDGWQIN